MSNYIIAIPSYKRDETLKKKTMNLLKHYKISPKKICIFVADKDEKQKYENTLDSSSYSKIIVGKKGIKEIRNFMANYFPENQKIVYMDDDISKIVKCNNNIKPYDKKNNKLEQLDNLDKFIKEAFNYSKKTKLNNWGVYPTDNPYFMKSTTNNYNDYVSTNLRFLIGFLTGVINKKKSEIRTIGDKEDYERTIKYYINDGGVIRFNNISCNTRCYKEPGGIQSMRKKIDSKRNALKLIKDYPNFVKINNNRNSGFVEIRLNDSSKLSKKKLFKKKNFLKKSLIKN
jgi:hypothetical protein